MAWKLVVALVGMVLVSCQTAQVSAQQSSRAAAVAGRLAGLTERWISTPEKDRSAELAGELESASYQLDALGSAGVRELDQILAESDAYSERVAAAYGLYILDPSRVEETVAELMVQMNRTMFANTELAESLIVAIGAPAVPVLIHHLNDSMVIHLLGRMGPAAATAVPQLRTVLGEANVEVANALAAIGTAEAHQASLPVLLDTLEDPHDPQQKEALVGLAIIGPAAAEATPWLRRATTHEDPEIRLRAALALIEVGDVGAGVAGLAEVVGSQELENPYAAIRKLGALGEQAREAVPTLLTIVEEAEEPGERALAAEALLKIDPENKLVKEAVRNEARRNPTLQRALEEGDS